jgi:lipoprotein-anchoring transpeptidase ErfK/SrfK
MEIHLADHRLKVFDGRSVVLDTEIGVGTTDTPTPGGVFFIKELLQPPSPNGVYGTYAYGLSGFSTVLQTFNGGNGVIGVHGTNDPSTIGSDVSHGCIRLLNTDIEKLVEDIGLPLGTPVAINA